jgi:pimeloyl-ACP methyl ester carboxylesterase
MATQPDENKPTIVLVHGAWADATGFDPEIRALQHRGFHAIGFANPLRDLRGDATYLAEFLRTLTDPIVLVGHSYGGNVISNAATGNDQVQALVYFNGWMCDEGERPQLSSSCRPSRRPSYRRQVARRTPTHMVTRLVRRDADRRPDALTTAIEVPPFVGDLGRQATVVRPAVCRVPSARREPRAAGRTDSPHWTDLTGRTSSHTSRIPKPHQTEPASTDTETRTGP